MRVEGQEGSVLNFCANNYLGFCNRPELVGAAAAALQTHGLGLASVRFICGTQSLHKRLEEQISAFHRTDDTILYPSCFDANAGLFEAILSKDDAILRYSHLSGFGGDVSVRVDVVRLDRRPQV